MVYLSKGIISKKITKTLLQVARCGQEYTLSEERATLWLGGRFGFSKAESESEEICLRHLESIGLVETEPEDTDIGRYRLLTRCVFCPASYSKPEILLSSEEKELLLWLRNAGLRLTVAELISLREREIKPEPQYLGEENRQALVEAIYTSDNIEDSLLEHLMETAKCKDKTLQTLMRLLDKKKVLVL